MYLNRCPSGYFFYLSECVPGLLNYISYTALINAGYTDIFNQPYSQATSSLDVDAWRANCNADTILCLGGSPAGDDIIRVLACGNCYAITTVTALNTPALNGLAWWYYTTANSIGFSPDNIVTQSNADVYDMASELRLSWHTDTSGGYRAGSLTSYGTNIQKYVFFKNMAATSRLQFKIFYIFLCL